MIDKNESAFTEAIRDTLPKAQPVEPGIITPANSRPLPVAKLLNWLLNCWDEQTICARDMQAYNRFIHNHEEAKNLAEILVQRGWLIPIPAHRIDRKLWLIVRNPAQIKTVDTVDVVLTSNQASHELSARVQAA